MPPAAPARWCEALVAGEADAAFCGLRPAGHHADRDRAMGFCLFNNVAVAAQLAIAELGVERVLIVDWDVHHGNGTAEIFRKRDDVLYASIHQADLFPGHRKDHRRGLGRRPRLHAQPPGAVRRHRRGVAVAGRVRGDPGRARFRARSWS